jgi:hypothetical protein
MSVCSKVFPVLSYSSSTVWGLMLRSLIQLGLVVVQGQRLGISFSFLLEDIPFPLYHLLRGWLFSNICFEFPCQKSNGCSYTDLCMGLLFCFTGLWIGFCASTMLLLLLWLCSIVWSQVLWYLQCCFLCSLFKVFSASIWIFLREEDTGILMGTTVITWIDSGI